MVMSIYRMKIRSVFNIPGCARSNERVKKVRYSQGLLLTLLLARLLRFLLFPGVVVACMVSRLTHSHSHFYNFPMEVKHTHSTSPFLFSKRSYVHLLLEPLTHLQVDPVKTTLLLTNKAISFGKQLSKPTSLHH